MCNNVYKTPAFFEVMWKNIVELTGHTLGEGKSWGEVKQLARNRIRWRRFVDALCP
jgi:hypothetical protein